MIGVVAVAVLVAALAAPEDPDLKNPDGVFGDGSQSDVIDIGAEEYRELVKPRSRDYTVVILVTSGDETGRSCQMCPYMNKQYNDYVVSFKEQYKGGRTYFEDAPVYFTRVLMDRSTDSILKDLKVRGVPKLLVLKPGEKPVFLGQQQLEDKGQKAIDLAISEEMEKKKKAGKSAARAVKRAERRARLVGTQEQQEYERHGMRMQNPTTNNICKFMRMKAGLHTAVCPQDVPLDFQQKKKPQDLLKNALMFVIAGSGAVVIARVFGIGIETVKPNREELLTLMHLKDCVNNGDIHNMAGRRPDWEIYGTHAVYAVMIGVYSMLIGGSYWNILHNVPMGHASGLAMLAGTSAVALILSGYAVSEHFLSFTQRKGAVLQLAPEMREHIRVILGAGGVVVWWFMFLAILKLFVAKNGSYQRGSSLEWFIQRLR